MRPDIKHIIQDRLQGHEAPVDPGVWRAIQSKLAVAAPASDPVEDLFRDRLGEHQMDPGPGTWEAISSQLGHTVAGTVASSGMFGWAAAGIGVVIVAAGIYLATGDDRQELATVPQVDNELVLDAQIVPEITIETNTHSEIAAENVVVETSEIAVVVSDRSIEKLVAPSTTITKEAPASSPLDKSEGSTPVHPGTTTTPDQDRTNSAASDNNATETPEADKVTPTRNEEGPALVEQIIQKMIVEAEENVADQPSATDRSYMSEAPPFIDTDVIEEPQVREAPLPKLFLPNTFTPNQDGHNDEYIVPGEGFSQVAVSIISVMDGQQVFKSNDARMSWNGATCPNGDCPVGHYIVAVEAITDDGRIVTKSQIVWLMR